MRISDGAAPQRHAAPAGRPPAARPAGVAQRALALQQRAGNRAARRVLARWTRHPDPEQKGVMVPDSAAEEFARCNPPQNA